MARKPRETTCTPPNALPCKAAELSPRFAETKVRFCKTKARFLLAPNPLVRWCLAVLLLLPGVTLSGCELGNTMFQYSSGGSPWMGINLLPKKRSTSVIKHEGKPALTPSRKAEVQLVQQEGEVMEGYRKKPLRLSLPAYRDNLQPTELTTHPETGFSVDSFAEKQF